MRSSSCRPGKLLSAACDVAPPASGTTTQPTDEAIRPTVELRGTTVCCVVALQSSCVAPQVSMACKDDHMNRTISNFMPISCSGGVPQGATNKHCLAVNSRLTSPAARLQLTCLFVVCLSDAMINCFTSRYRGLCTAGRT
jgi:hypothetical protein